MTAPSLDASTPAFVFSATSPVATASFNPPAGALLVAKCVGDWFGGTPSLSVTSSGLTFERVSRHGNGTAGGLTEIWVCKNVPTGSRTVSLATTLSGSPVLGLKVEVWTGYDLDDPIDALVGATNQTTNNLTANVVTLTDDAWVSGIGSEWQNLGAATSTDVNEHGEPGATAMLTVRKAAAKATAGTETLNFDAFGTGTPAWTWTAIAIRPATTGPTIYRVADRGRFNSITTATSSAVDLPNAGSIAVGNYLVARIALDNAGTNGAAPSCTITDPRSNTWTVTTAANVDPGAANAGATCYIAYAKVTNAYTNGDDITVNHSPTVPARAIVIEEWAGIHATTPVAVAAVTGTGSTAAVSLARTPTAPEQVMYTAVAVEGSGIDHYDQDKDQTEGSWVMLSQEASTSGTALSNQTIYGSFKRVTGTSAQTWSVNLPGARDWAGIAIVFNPAPASGVTGTLAGTMAAQTASLTGSAVASGTVAGSIAAQTGSFTGQVVTPVSGTLSGSVAAQTASLTGSAVVSAVLTASLSAQVAGLTGTLRATGTVAGTISAQTGAFTGSSRATATLTGSIAGQTVSITGALSDSGALSGTFSAQTASLAGSLRASGALAGAIAAQTGAFTGTIQTASADGVLAGVIAAQTATFSAQIPTQGSLAGTMAAQTAAFTAAAQAQAALVGALPAIIAAITGTSSASGQLAGTFSAVTMSGTAQVLGAPRDLTVTIVAVFDGPTFQSDPPDVSFATTADGPQFTTDPLGVTFEPAGGNTIIGGSQMNPKWRVGSKEFIDFTMTLTGDVEGLTQAEVEGLDFQIAIGGNATPDIDDFFAPSVTPVVTPITGGFTVKIKHLHTATAKGNYVVYVTFGATPEQPIYQAVKFQVL